MYPRPPSPHDPQPRRPFDQPARVEAIQSVSQFNEHPAESLKRLPGPLMMIFWGGILVIVDWTYSQTTNGSGWKVDWFNDFVGTILIFVGVVRIRGNRSAWFCQGRLAAIAFITFLAMIKAAVDFYVTNHPSPVWANITSALHLFEIAAILLFVFTMRSLCLRSNLPRSTSAWTVTAWLFVLIYGLGLGGLYVRLYIAFLSKDLFRLWIPGWGVVFLLWTLFAVPLVAMLIATLRMSGEAKEAATIPVYPTYEG